MIVPSDVFWTLYQYHPAGVELIDYFYLLA
jgi:hypothetical protein